jgi:hypothetical protein
MITVALQALKRRLLVGVLMRVSTPRNLVGLCSLAVKWGVET